jgi:hypothetical protein
MGKAINLPQPSPPESRASVSSPTRHHFAYIKRKERKRGSDPTQRTQSSKSRTSTATCARFAASATREKSLRKTSAVFWVAAVVVVAGGRVNGEMVAEEAAIEEPWTGEDMGAFMVDVDMVVLVWLGGYVVPQREGVVDFL